MLFRAGIDEKIIETEDDIFRFKPYEKVLTTEGWKRVKDIEVGEVLVGDNEERNKVSDVLYDDDLVTLYI